MVKQQLEEAEERGWHDVGTLICNHCVFDDFLKKAILTHGSDARCDYCKNYRDGTNACVPIERVLELVVTGLNHEYEDPINVLPWDGGFVAAVYDTWDIIGDLEITERLDVHRALHTAITQDAWCQCDPLSLTPTETLLWGLRHFHKHVKHSRRFTFLNERSFQTG